MTSTYTLKTIAHIQSDFPEKFGIPRQSGLVESLKAKLIFEPDYRNPDALRGLEDYSHIWLIWGFSEAIRDEWSPTVRPPRLGAIREWGCLPHVPHSGPIRLDCPASVWRASAPPLILARFSIFPEPT